MKRSSRLSGLECWTGVLEWSTGMESLKHWSGHVTTFWKVLGIFL